MNAAAADAGAACPMCGAAIDPEQGQCQRCEFATLDRLRILTLRNGREVAQQVPDMERAAAEVHEALWIMTEASRLAIPDGDRTWSAAAALSRGASQSWMLAYVMASAGFGDTAFSELRRAAEYVCYSAKIIGREGRLELWINRSKDYAARQKFSGQFGLPRAYLGSKYSHLRPMLVLHEEACGAGAHGNAANLIRNYRPGGAEGRAWGYLLPPSDVIPDCGTMVLYGLHLAFAMRRVLEPQLDDRDGSISGRIQAAEQSTRAMAGNRLGEKAVEAAAEDSDGMDTLFQQLMAREKGVEQWANMHPLAAARNAALDRVEARELAVERRVGRSALRSRLIVLSVSLRRLGVLSADSLGVYRLLDWLARRIPGLR